MLVSFFFFFPFFFPTTSLVICVCSFRARLDIPSTFFFSRELDSPFCRLLFVSVYLLLLLSLLSLS